jgi:hypothetical protein
MELALLDLNEHKMRNSRKLALLIQDFHNKKHNEAIASHAYIKCKFK